MATGIVKWFSNSKGYGFIAGDNGDEDIFAHFSTIDMEGYKTLKRGQAVVYELTNGPKGLHAQNIQLKALENGELENSGATETNCQSA